MTTLTGLTMRSRSWRPSKQPEGMTAGVIEDQDHIRLGLGVRREVLSLHCAPTDSEWRSLKKPGMGE